MKRAGVDVGGTFTDVVVLDEQEKVTEHKVPSDPSRLEHGVADGLLKTLGGRDKAADLGFLGHGTTVATNVTLERSGPRVALICTRGFRDIVEIARLAKPGSKLYTQKNVMPKPVVVRRDCFEVTERIDARGQVVAALDEGEVEAVLRQVVDRGITAVAVCLLFSFRNPAHERRIREIAARVAPSLEVSLSCEVWREFREYERASTTTLNSYLRPAAARYLANLQAVTGETFPSAALWVMQSNGGLTSAAAASEQPVRLVMSGPAGGVIGARYVADQTGLGDLLTVDMGGTSFDVSLLQSGTASLVDRQDVMGLPLQGRALDIMTIGSGGGSVAWVDGAGQFRVGPRSAGAIPGPACYGRGGTEPTVTDANLVLGLFDAEVPLAGGDLILDYDAAYRACEKLGTRLGLDPVETAWGIRTIVNAAMAGAVRTASVRRGLDPRDFAMLAFGGAGPLHAADIAAEMGIGEAVVPAVAGCFSALGIAITDAVHDLVHTESMAVDSGASDTARRHLTELITQGRDELRQSGIDDSLHHFECSVDMRYLGQNSTLNVPLRQSGRLDSSAEAFHAEHLRQFGHHGPDEPVELVNLRVRAVGAIGRRASSVESAKPSQPPIHGKRRVTVGDGETATAAYYERDKLSPGAQLEGPAIVSSSDTTIVVPPDARARVDGGGHLRISIPKAQGGRA
ncbi:hydantoinase/oxoprolinase family protein [Qaidamihabitans albus]|uniref:hydantoinase/oxoprolinase family protein n=1 Tax=Qaidamihabitans albus TaxID=2795733 RepID=UPI0018F1178E|nr:hydantoinase/oxoprolinase family protein [Qaidamihabitans albus]